MHLNTRFVQCDTLPVVSIPCVAICAATNPFTVISMATTPNMQSETTHLLKQLADTSCQWCDDGQLERGHYKSTAALICDACGTPTIRVWN